MEKVVRVFHSFEEAEAAEVEDLRMTPDERMEMLVELQRRVFPDATQQRFERVCRLIKREQS